MNNPVGITISLSTPLIGAGNRERGGHIHHHRPRRIGLRPLGHSRVLHRDQAAGQRAGEHLVGGDHVGDQICLKVLWDYQGELKKKSTSSSSLNQNLG